MSSGEPSGPARVSGALELRGNRSSTPNGVWGMALFVAAEVALFGTLLGTYFYLETTDKVWPPHHIKAPSVLFPLLLTGLLVATVVPVYLAARAGGRGQRARAILALSVAMVLQGAYLGLQIVLMVHDSRQFSPQGSAYGSIYYTLLAVHHAHVALGLALDLGIIAQLQAKGLTRYWRLALRNIALYWYVVSALAVAVVLTQLSPSL